MQVEFQPFQRVLVRDGENAEWVITLFCYAHHYEDGVEYVCLNGTGWPICLPYNDETKHLLGTTNSPTPPEPEFQFGDKVVVKNAEDGNWCEAIFTNYHGKDVAAILHVDPSVISLWRYCRHAEW